MNKIRDIVTQIDEALNFYEIVSRTVRNKGVKRVVVTVDEYGDLEVNAETK